MAGEVRPEGRGQARTGMAGREYDQVTIEFRAVGGDHCQRSLAGHDVDYTVPEVAYRRTGRPGYMVCDGFFQKLAERGAAHEYRVVRKPRAGICGEGATRFAPPHEHSLIGRIDIVRARLPVQSMVGFVRTVGQTTTDAFARLDNRYVE